MIYEVNTTEITPKIGAQILDFLSELGFYKSPKKTSDFICTNQMIDGITEVIKPGISSMENQKKLILELSLW